MHCHHRAGLPPVIRHLLIWILWRIWKSRNILMYQRKPGLWIEDLRMAQVDAEEWCQNSNHQKAIHHQHSTGVIPSDHNDIFGW